MNEKILKALMQLFAIVANEDGSTLSNEAVVETYLDEKIGKERAAKYLGFFEAYLAQLSKKSDGTSRKKSVSLSSVRILRICTELNEELDQYQKTLVFSRLIQFVYSSSRNISSQLSDFLETVAEVFHINESEKKSIYALCAAQVSAQIEADGNMLLVAKENGENAINFLEKKVSGSLWFAYLPSVALMIVKYFGGKQYYLNGQAIKPNRLLILPNGSVVRQSDGESIYYGDVVKHLGADKLQNKIDFELRGVEYFFLMEPKAYTKLILAQLLVS